MSIPADRSPSREEGLSSTRVRYSSPAHSGSGAAVEILTDDLLVEILSRVPAKSLCRCKCVSNHWLNLIDHPGHRKKLPQTMAGFFYTSTDEKRCPESALRFLDISESRRRPPVDTSFAFLPSHRRVHLLDSCNGLLLCRWYDVSTTGGDEFRYVVRNPATEDWVALPDPSHAGKVGIARLGFDPAVSSHFHVFVLLLDAGLIFTGANLYSSESRRWVHKDRRCDIIQLNRYQPATAFLNGYLHFHTLGPWPGPCLAAVDTAGETWTNFDGPSDHMYGGFIQQSQGRLHYANFVEHEDEDVADFRLVVYVMEDYGSKEWTLKHRVNSSHVFHGIPVGIDMYFDWIAIHPDCDLIFFGVARDIPLLCYNMNRREIKLIPHLGNVLPPYLTYVPLYSELHSLASLHM